jgi:hypothetical protein
VSFALECSALLFTKFRSAPAVKKPSFAVVPFDNANGPTACPAHLLHVGEDGTASPIELVSGAFELFEGAALEYVGHCCSLSVLKLTMISLCSFTARSTRLCSLESFDLLSTLRRFPALESTQKNTKITLCGVDRIVQSFLRCWDPCRVATLSSRPLLVSTFAELSQ